MAPGKVKVLYIAGSGRSGSTVLTSILGQVDGVFAAGELRFLWERGLLEGRLCGCGVPLRDCALWRRVLDLVIDGDDREVARRMIAHQQRSSRIRHIPYMLGSRWRPQLLTRRFGDYPEILARLYGAVRTVSGCELVVDSSKLPAYAYALAQVPSIDLHVVHLVRDPRAAAHSWKRRKVQPDRGSPGYMEQQSALKSSVLWTVWNATAEALGSRDPSRYLRVRYEDFVASPREVVEEILALAGVSGAALPFADDHRVVLEIGHTAAGNPNRLDTGAVALRPDDEWVRHMQPRDRTVVTTVTAPLLVRYGFPVRAAGGPGSAAS